jgi:hypothetical protein
MKPTNSLTRALACAALALIGLTAACSAEQQQAVANNFARQQAILASTALTSGLSDASLARLAACESGGNPTARSRSGSFFGLYQFDQHTWNGVAASVLPEFVGVNPANAPAPVQDAMARALYSARGRSPWPVCGRHM